MTEEIKLNVVYRPSDAIVAREIEGEVIIVPLTAGIGDMESELFTLNETGRAIWNLLDGTKSVQAIVDRLASEYEAPKSEIEQDVVGLLKEIYKRRIIVECSGE